LKTTQRIERKEKSTKEKENTRYKMYKITACFHTSISDKTNIRNTDVKA
jgi:hypothetical protein